MVSKGKNKAAQEKKRRIQYEGLERLEAILGDILAKGLGALDTKAVRHLDEQGRQLGNMYLPGVQAMLRKLTGLFYGPHAFAPSSNGVRDDILYHKALALLIRLNSLCLHGRRFLDGETAGLDHADIAALLGHGWTLTELKNAGHVQENAELVQLAFYMEDNPAARQFEDTGIWLNFTSGQIQISKTLRPYQAARHIQEDDAVYGHFSVPELFVYPGGLNPRIRWKEAERRELLSDDFERIRSCACPGFSELIYRIKSHIRFPLAPQKPLALVRYESIAQEGERLWLKSPDDEFLPLAEDEDAPEPETCALLSLLSSEYLNGQMLLGRFFQNPKGEGLCLKPLSIVSSEEIIRMGF